MSTTLKPMNRLKGWITIGGSPGERGENEGGTHVFIDDKSGKITAGPSALMGKPINRLDQNKLKPGEKPKPPKPKKPEPESEPEQPTVQTPEPGAAKPSADGFPADLTKLKKVKLLGGSTGAELVEDPETGKQYVRKKGDSADHLRSEAAADAAYRALGVPVPEYKLYDTSSGPVKLAEYLEGTLPLAELPPVTRKAAEEKLRQNFVADALLGNWDVVGLEADNVRVSLNGAVYRIDNGGALSYRAQGAKKSAAAWGPEVTELETLRDPKVNPQAAKVFGAVTDGQIREQVKEVLSKRETLLQALPEVDAKVVTQRLDWLKQKYGTELTEPSESPVPAVETATPEQVAPSQVSPPPELPAASPVPAKVPDYVGQPLGKGSRTPAKMDKFGKEHIAKLDPSVKQAVVNYTGSSYAQLNSDMRKCPPDFGCVMGQSKQLMDRVNEAVSVRLPEPVTVYRGAGLTLDVQKKVLEAAKKAMEEGSDYGMPSITSTSFKASTSFMKSSNLVFHVRAKTGLPVSSISKYESEHELIQSGNAKYKVVGVAEAPYGTSGKKKHVIYLEEQEWLPNPTKMLTNGRTNSKATTSGLKPSSVGTRSAINRRSPTVKSPNPSLSSPIAAGLAVVADDTGRVLMLQRSLADGDPNGGKWEFPGGRIEGREMAVQTALREWAEEVGLDVPTSTEPPKRWDSSDGKYAGFVVHVPSEDVLDMTARDWFSDPNSEVGGVVAWVHPRDLPQHNLRPELLSDVDEVMAKVTKWLLARQVRKSIEEYQILSMAGQSRTASESGGVLFHAVPGGKVHGDDMRTALCGKSPGRRSAGWVTTGNKVTCPECLRRLGKAQKSGPGNRLKSSFFEECERDEQGHCKPGEGGGASEPEAAKPDQEQQARRHVVNTVLSAVGSVALSVKDAAKGAASKVGQAAWDKMSPKAQQRLARTYQLAKAVEHKVMTGFRAANQLAVKAAEERGLPPESAERVGKLLAVVDVASAWTVNMPAALAVTGSASAAKVASWVPVASLAYLGYSTARNPFATVRAARKMVRDWRTGKDGHKSLEKSMGLAGLAGQLTERMAEAQDPDLWAALLSAALDEVSDPEEAMDAADELSRRWIQERKSLGPVNRLKGSYFEECERDEQGHCLPSGQAGASGHTGNRKLESKSQYEKRTAGKKGYADYKAYAAVVKKAAAKIANAPVPSEDAVAKAKEELRRAKEEGARPGGESRGGSAASRRKQRENLFQEFGGEGKCCCHGCGLKLSTDLKPGSGVGRLERGKIFTKCQGGGYQLPNLVPECFDCNRGRNDAPVRKENPC